MLRCLAFMLLMVGSAWASWNEAKVQSVLSNASKVLGWQANLGESEKQRFSKSCQGRIRELSFEKAHPVWGLIGALGAELDHSYHELARKLVQTYTENPDQLRQVTGFSWGTKACDVHSVENAIYLATKKYPSFLQEGKFLDLNHKNKLDLLMASQLPGIQAIASGWWETSPLPIGEFQSAMVAATSSQNQKEIAQKQWHYWRAGFLGREDLFKDAGNEDKFYMLCGASCSSLKSSRSMFDRHLSQFSKEPLKDVSASELAKHCRLLISRRDDPSKEKRVASIVDEIVRRAGQSLLADGSKAKPEDAFDQFTSLISFYDDVWKSALKWDDVTTAQILLKKFPDFKKTVDEQKKNRRFEDWLSYRPFEKAKLGVFASVKSFLSAGLESTVQVGSAKMFAALIAAGDDPKTLVASDNSQGQIAVRVAGLAADELKKLDKKNLLVELKKHLFDEANPEFRIGFRGNLLCERIIGMLMKPDLSSLMLMLMILEKKGANLREVFGQLLAMHSLDEEKRQVLQTISNTMLGKRTNSLIEMLNDDDFPLGQKVENFLKASTFLFVR